MDKVKCPECGKEYSKMGIGNHIWRTHGEGKNFDPNKGYKDGIRKGTNHFIKGTKIEHSEETKKKIKKALTGKHLSDETKQIISIKRRKYLENNPDKVPYLLNHSSKISYPEKKLMDALNNSNIKGWEYNYQNGIYQYDFAFPEIRLDIEIDGATHNQSKVQEIDKRRDEWSRSQGWKVVRFKATEVTKNLQYVIDKIKEIIEGKVL